MEDGEVFVKKNEKKELDLLSVNGNEPNIGGAKNKKNHVEIYIVWIFAVLATISIIVLTNLHEPSTKEIYGGYETAEEYVNNLVVVTKLTPVQNTLISNWYGYEITVNNNNKRVVKYIYYEFKAFNAVEDYVKSEFDGTEFKITGPINSGEGGKYSGSASNYCRANIKKLVITAFKIEFMDGTNVKYNKTMLEYLNRGI